MRRYLLAVMLCVAILLPGLSWVTAQGDGESQGEFPVILDLAITSYPENYDPQLTTGSSNRTFIENMFVGLTDLNPFTGEITPELATSWEVNEEAMVWTFHLRSDVNWVRYDAETEAAEIIRPVTAEDVVYGIQRACDPRLNLGSPNVNDSVINIIQGCRDVFDDSNADDRLVHGDTIRVAALDSEAVQIQLTEPAAYFLSMTVMPLLRSVYREAIEEHGEDWTDVNHIVTSGPYLLADANENKLAFVHNGDYPEALWHGGNIDRVYFTVIEDGGTIYALFQDMQLDRSGVPAAEVPMEPRYPEHSVFIHDKDAAVFYYGFDHSKPPFDNVHVRRAFSATIDRPAFVEQLLQNRGIPNAKLLPRNLQTDGGEAITVGFDPEYAQQQLALAGYPDCDGFPSITIYTYQGADNWGEFWAVLAEEYLGCASDLFQILEFDFATLLQLIDASASRQSRPNAWTLGWGEHYPDPHDWYVNSGVVACGPENDTLRECSTVDELIQKAAQTIDPERRNALYLQIEEGLFGVEGEFPVAPIYLRSSFSIVAEWYTGPFETEVSYWGQHWDAYSIDMEAKLAARGEAEQ